jgi:hypothetical protein
MLTSCNFTHTLNFLFLLLSHTLDLRKRFLVSCGFNISETSHCWWFLLCPLLTCKLRVTVSEHPPIVMTHSTPWTVIGALAFTSLQCQRLRRVKCVRCHGNAFPPLKVIVIYFQLAMSLTLWTHWWRNGLQLSNHGPLSLCITSTTLPNTCSITLGPWMSVRLKNDSFALRVLCAQTNANKAARIFSFKCVI